MKKLLMIILLVMNIPSLAQGVSGMLEHSLSAVVTVALKDVTDEEKFLGFRGNASNTAYGSVLDLSEFVGSGSGFIIERNGKKYVVTNAHVVAPAKDGEGNIIAFSLDRSEYKMKILGGDTFYDMALLEFLTPPGAELTTMNFRKDEVRIGEQVFALGNPAGEFPYSVSEGIISAKNRVRNEIPYGRLGFIQTTAALYYGNSGGPLIDTKGRVVGINSQIFIDRSGGFDAFPVSQINFSLEAKVVERLINDILSNNGLIRRSFIGVEVSQSFEKSYYYSLREKLDSLPVISAVIPGSPAYQYSDLLVGKALTAINGVKITNVNQVIEEMEKCIPGESISLSIISEGTERDITLNTIPMDFPQLNSICRYFFESERGSVLTVGTDHSVTIKPGEGFFYDPLDYYYSVEDSLFFTEMENKDWTIAGAGFSRKYNTIWKIKSLGDLGAVLRLCGPFGYIQLYLIDKSDPDAELESLKIMFSGDDLIRKEAVWY